MYSTKEKMKIVVRLVVYGAGGVILFLMALVLGTRLAEIKKTKIPLCVVCGRSATRKSWAQYAPFKELPSGAPAWLCESCEAPPKISERSDFVDGAYSHVSSEGLGLKVAMSLVILGIVVCIIGLVQGVNEVFRGHPL